MGTTEKVAEVKEEQKGDILILRIRGRIDAVSSPTIEKRIFDSIEAGQERLLLDFAGVTYLSSAGLRMLLSTTKKIRSLPGKVHVCNMVDNVLDVFKMSGFDHVLDLFQTEEDALRHF